MSDEAQDDVQAVYDYAAKQLMKDVPPEKVVQSLVEQGLKESDARTVVDQLVVAKREALKKHGQKQMLYGGLWCIGGIVVTAATYQMAADGGGKYVVAWGAILFGAIQFFRGLAQSSGN